MHTKHKREEGTKKQRMSGRVADDSELNSQSEATRFLHRTWVYVFSSGKMFNSRASAVSAPSVCVNRRCSVSVECRSPVLWQYTEPNTQSLQLHAKNEENRRKNMLQAAVMRVDTWPV